MESFSIYIHILSRSQSFLSYAENKLWGLSKKRHIILFFFILYIKTKWLIRNALYFKLSDQIVYEIITIILCSSNYLRSNYQMHRLQKIQITRVDLSMVQNPRAENGGQSSTSSIIILNILLFFSSSVFKSSFLKNNFNFNYNYIIIFYIYV